VERVTPLDQSELVDICERASRHDYIGLDTETTGFFLHQHDVLRGVSLAFGDEAWYVPVSHPASVNFDPRPIRQLLAETRALVGLHNSPFDLTALDRAGLGTIREGHLYDTQVGDWLIDENLDHRLKEGVLTRLRGRDEAMEEKLGLQPARDEGRDWPTFTADDIAAYAADDARGTLEALHDQLGRMPDMEHDCPLPDLRREIDFQRVLKRVMDNGMRVDQERAEAQYQEQLKRRDELAEHFGSIQLPGTKLRGRAPNKYEVPLYEPGVNMNSPKQLRILIYDMWGLEPYLTTPTGERSTSREALEPHAYGDDGEILDQRIADLLAHRRADKACAGFYEPLARFLGADGRVHCSLNSARTVTGRLSHQNPNMSTIPRADVIAGIRNCIIPGDGNELWEFDLDSAELRIIGAVTKEAAIFDAMKEGRDLHSETAADVFGPNFTGLQRRLAKNMNYGYPYGIGPEKLARYLAAGPPRVPMTPRLVAQARRMKARYAATYPRMTAMMKALEKQARKHGSLPLSKPGRYRRFKTMRVKQGEAKYFTALNALVQGTVAELMKDVMLSFEGNVDGLLVMQVHDSLVVEVEPGTGYHVQAQLQRLVDEHSVFSEMPMPISAKVWGS
jgi:DNA polymerase-1